MQEAIKKQKGQYITIYGDEIHLLNRGSIYDIDKQYQLHPEKMPDNILRKYYGKDVMKIIKMIYLLLLIIR